MRLLLDLQGLQSASRYRGIGRLTSALALSIVERAGGRHDVHALFNEGLTEDLPPAAETIRRRLPRENVHGFGPFRDVAEHAPANRWRAGSAALVREAVVAALRPDVVHLSSLFEGFVDEAVTSVGRLAAPHLTAVTLYDLIPLSAPEQYLGDPTYRGYYLQRAQDLKRADRLLAISDFSGREAETRLQIPAERISVVGAGVSDEFRPVRLDPAAEAALRARLGLARRIVLHVGAVDPRKNVGLLIDAFARLPRGLSAARQLCFVGPINDGERQQLLALGSRLRLPADAIVVPGRIAQDDLVALYGIADALVFPSTNEGFGLPPLEAMACGLPVLAADATSLPGVVGRADCLFDPADAGQLAERMERLLTQEAWRSELRSWGLERAATFGWDRVGERALAALERTADEHADRRGAAAPIRRRPRMAFVSPLPPEQTGIADYSAELLRELLRFYDVDCIHPDEATSDAWVAANCRLKSVEWFRAQAAGYDRILYSIGNSMFHAHMFDLMVRFPGTVILHDAFLADLAFHMNGGVATGAVLKELYRSHGLTGLRLLREGGMQAVIEALTMSGPVFRNAQGVIVHSRHTADLAVDAFGPEVEREIAIVPQLRSLPVRPDRAAARRRLGLATDAFVVCSFGIVSPRKSNRLVAEAFVASTLASDAACTLLFVGEDNAPYSRAILDEVVRPASASGTVRVVGRVDDETYGLHLAAADVAVQLRTESRGETSRAVLDAMAHGLPTVVSDLGSAAELPDAAVVKLPAGAGADVLAAILDRLRADPDYRLRMGESARDEIARNHHPAVVGERIRDLVDGFAASGPGLAVADLITALADLPAAAGSPSRADLEPLARHVRALSPPPRLRQILYDVSAIARQDLRTGIERVVRAVAECLIQAPPHGFRIEPVIIGEDGYDYARRFSAERLGLSNGEDLDEPVEFGRGDHFLGVDWVADRLPSRAGWLERFRRAGGTVTIVVHDILPLEQPRYFPDWLHEVEERWFETIVRSADHLACVSASVADSVLACAPAFWGDRHAPLPVAYFHHGHDLAASRPSAGLPDESASALAAITARPTFLMVGTVEPRKGYHDAVAAFEILWAEGVDVGLCIVGKEGWMAGHGERIRASTEHGRRLLWFPAASDEWLGQLYDGAAALIAASYGEGFGLPLVEAAGHGLAVVARDIPVFREVAGDHAFYFRDGSPDDLADALRTWLALRAEGRVPPSGGMGRRTWLDATNDLVAIMQGERLYSVLKAGAGAGLGVGS